MVKNNIFKILRLIWLMVDNFVFLMIKDLSCGLFKENDIIYMYFNFKLILKFFKIN